MSARESPTSSQVRKVFLQLLMNSPCQSAAQFYFSLKRRHRHPIVRAAVYGMQVLQKSQDQPLPEDQVSVVWLIYATRRRTSCSQH